MLRPTIQVGNSNKMDEHERAELVRRAVCGDEEALQRLIIYYHEPLSGTIRGRMNAAHGRHLEPENILQQAYVSAFQSIRDCTFDTPGGFYTRLERIAFDKLRNAECDLHRKKRDIGRNVAAAPATSSYLDLLNRLPASHAPTATGAVHADKVAIATASGAANRT